jgi:hypothetical protein
MMILGTLSKLTRSYSCQQPCASLLKLLPNLPIEHFTLEDRY